MGCGCWDGMLGWDGNFDFNPWDGWLMDGYSPIHMLITAVLTYMPGDWQGNPISRHDMTGPKLSLDLPVALQGVSGLIQ